MKKITTAAIAAATILLSTQTVSAAEEKFSAKFNVSGISDAPKAYTWKQVVLELNIQGKTKKLVVREATTGWIAPPEMLAARKISYVVLPGTPIGELRFALEAESTDGQKDADSWSCVNLGTEATASGKKANTDDKTSNDQQAEAPQANTPAAQNQILANVGNSLNGLEARVEGNLFTAPISLKGKQPDGSTPWSNNAGSVDVQLQVKDSPLFVGFQFRSAPEDGNANVNGDKGAAAYGGLRFQPDANVSLEVKAGLNRDDSGKPFYGAVRVQGNPAVERFAHDLQVTTNLGFLSASYNGGMRFLGDPNGARAELAAGGQYRHDFKDSSSHPSVWTGLRGTTPIDPTLWKGEIRLTLGYLLPVNGWDGKSQYPDGALIGLEIRPLVTPTNNAPAKTPPPSGGTVVRAL